MHGLSVYAWLGSGCWILRSRTVHQVRVVCSMRRFAIRLSFGDIIICRQDG